MRFEFATATRILFSPGISSHDVAVLCDNVTQASSMKGNPLVLTPDELREILNCAL